jgi:outer membrane protein
MAGVKAVVIGLALTVGGGGMATAAAQAGPASVRIGFVNARAVLEAMPGYAQAESTFTREAEQGQAEVQRLQARLDSLVREFQQQEPMLSATTRQARRRELDTQAQQLQQQANDIRARIARREMELLQPMQQRLVAMLEGMRAEMNLAMIIDIGAPETGIVTWDRSLDLTQRVIERLRQNP